MAIEFKLPKPEDYPEEEQYIYQVIKAYSQTYSKALIILARIEGVVNVSDIADKEYMLAKLERILKDHS